MWFGKSLYKKLAFSLVAVFATAVSSMAADVRPLRFQGISEDLDVQQAYWDSLMMYKMFGTNGIVFAQGGNIKITDKTGRFGTAKGDFVLTENGGNDFEVGGPILIGGDIRMGGGTGNVEFSTGPTRVTGTVIIKGDNLNGGAGTNHFRGYNCVGAQPSPAYDSYAENKFFGNNYNSCPDSVPHVMSDLSIPALIRPASAVDGDSINQTNGAVYNLDIPEGKEMYDLYIPSIKLENGASINVRMPKGGRLTRIFLKSMAISSQTTIHVQYKNDQGGYDTVADTAYAGNLLFYVESSIILEARTNGRSLHGTFISTETIQVAQQTTLSGQFLAKNLIISANFDGSGFHYVPFDPKFFDPEAGSFGTIYEGAAFVDSLQPLTVRLNEAPKNPVTFDYCFIVDGPADAGLAENNFEASLADIDQTDFPLCSKNQKKSARFSPNRDTLDSRITVKVVNDGILENLERFKIKIFNLEGAVYSEEDAGREGEFFIYIEDDDRTPVCRDTTLVGLEDEIIQFTKGKINEFPAFANDSVTPLDSFGVAILTAPVNSFTVFGIPVDLTRPISSSDRMGEVRYTPGLNEYGEDGKHYDSLTFAIEVNKGVRSEPCKMYFDIKPVNDKPVLNDTTITIRENTPVDSVLLQLVATDVENDKLTYAIDSGDVALFTLKGAVKDSLVLKGALDYETQKVHVLKVVVTDDGEGNLKDTAYVTIKLIDENEKPKFDSTSYTFEIAEHTIPGGGFDLIGTIKASDPDSNSAESSYKKLRYEYKLIDPAVDDSAFVLLSGDVGTFTVYNADSLNFEKRSKYVLWAYAIDAGDLYDSVKVTINVKDINETPFYAKDKFYYKDAAAVSIPENSAPQNLLTFNFKDLDVNSALVGNAGFHTLQLSMLECTRTSCDLTADKDVDSTSVLNSLFEVVKTNDTTGVLKFIGSGKIDYEQDSVYNMLLEIRDNVNGVPSLADTIVVQVKITNINESPKFDSTSYTFKIEENKDPQSLGLIKATDKDFHSVLTYTFANGEDVDETGKFRIVDATEGAFIYTTEPLDYEEKQSYSFKVYVTDNGKTEEGGTLKDSTIVNVIVIDVNEKPEAEDVDCVIAETAKKGTAPTLDEDGSSVKCAVVGTDPDKLNPNFRVLSYKWNDLNEEGADIFKIDSQSGAVTLDKDNALDADDGTILYTLSVLVADNGIPSLTDTVKVRIRIKNINEPPFLADTTIHISEKTPVDSQILYLLASDAETAPNLLTYKITSSSPSADFKLTTVRGELGKYLTVKNSLDFDKNADDRSATDSVYTLKVTVKDCGLNGNDTLTHVATITIILTDENEPPYFNDDQPYFYLAEHNLPGAVAGPDKLDAGDDDVNPAYNKLTYLMIQDTSGLFDVSEYGSVSVRDSNVLNYESVPKDKLPPIYVITVGVTDGFDTVTALATIEVTDINEKPSLADATFHMPEHDADAVVGPVVGSDKDYWLKTGRTDSLQYNILGKNDIFYVEPNGLITLKKPLDFESINPAEYTFDVVVTDWGNPAMKDTATVTIIVDDVNEKPKAWDQEFRISEKSKYPDSVGTFTNAKDDDTRGTPNATLVYDIADTVVDGVVTNGTQFFSINKSTGKISVKSGKTFNYESPDTTFYLKMIVSDKGEPVMRDTALVTIHIYDEPEPPVFDGEIPDMNVDENSPEGVVVGEVEAVDQDGNETLTYSLANLDGTKSKEFTILNENNKAKILVRENAGLDYEAKTSYKVLVTVVDKDGFSASAEVTISVNDVNEKPTMEEQYFELYENSGANYKLDGTIQSGDLDTASAFTKNFYEGVGGDTALFTVNSRGEIFANYDMDYEEFKAKNKTTFVVMVKVQDKVVDTLYVVENIHIDLKNVNENPEVLTDTLYASEDAKAGTEIGLLDADDPDGPTTFTYTLVRASRQFDVDPDGSVTVKTDDILDYETKDHAYTIYVNVQDADGGVSETKPVVIIVSDVNEPPTLRDTTIYIREDASVDTIFAKIFGHDPDIYTEAFNQLSYEMLSPKDTFDILPDGSVKLLRRLDYEADSLYERVVRVTDGTFFDTANVIIKVIDVIESTVVEIVKVDDPDSTWNYPDTIYTNIPNKSIDWLREDKIFNFDTTLVEGPNVIKRCYWNRTKNYEGCDSVIIYYSNATPVVKIYSDPADVSADNVYTIVEQTDKSDTNYYVNSTEKKITVSVTDTAAGVKKKFDINLELDTVGVPEKTLNTVNEITKEKVTLRDGSDVEVVKTPVNGEKIVVSYMDTVTVNGEPMVVKVSYDTDSKGNETKVAVINEKGKVDSIQVITVTYTTKIGDKEMMVSYKADAITGEVLNTTAGGQLTKADNNNDVATAQDAVGTFSVSYNYVDHGNAVTVNYVVDEKGEIVTNEDGDIGYSVSYSYTNKFGNTATKSVFIVLDTVGPKVEILYPVKGKKTEVVTSNFINVKWTVNGEKQDTLTTQGLEKGLNAIVRFYRDKAGNEASDTVFVYMKNGKNIEIAVEQPVTEITREKVEEYYSKNEPVEGQTFAVSIMNPTSGQEYETQRGGKNIKDEADTKGSGDAPYPGLEGHLGPTLALDIKLPVVRQTNENAQMDGLSTGTISGLATLDDIVNSEGLISLDGVDANNGEKLTVDEYVKEYCVDGFNVGSDLSRENLYYTKANVKIWVYTTTGEFVNYYNFNQKLNDPDYTNEAGMTRLFFEMKPDANGDVRNDAGRLIGTGSYIYKVEVKIRSELKCSLPPVMDASSPKKGDVIRNDEDLLKSFGYKRPALK